DRPKASVLHTIPAQMGLLNMSAHAQHDGCLLSDPFRDSHKPFMIGDQGVSINQIHKNFKTGAQVYRPISNNTGDQPHNSSIEATIKAGPSASSVP
ncbi:hypothetical protein E2320_002303, partial [Naja naja]